MVFHFRLEAQSSYHLLQKYFCNKQEAGSFSRPELIPSRQPARKSLGCGKRQICVKSLGKQLSFLNLSFHICKMETIALISKLVVRIK